MSGHSQRHSSHFPKKARLFRLVEGALQVHVQESFPEPTSDGVDDGFAAVLRSEPVVLVGDAVSCPRKPLPAGPSTVRRRRVSPTTTGHLLLSLFFQAASEALAIQKVMVPGMLPLAMMRTVARRHRINSPL